MRSAILGGAMSLPVELVDVPAIERATTAKYQPMGADEPLVVPLSTVVGDRILVPRQYGLSLCLREGIAYTDETSAGYPAKFPKVPKPRDYQVDPLLEVQRATEEYYDFIFRARTGWGKTIGSLILAARLGRTTLILVDQENLKDQWIASLVQHFGFKLEDIGIIQGQRCDYKGKAVTIAMVHTLRKGMPADACAYFGFVIVDEVHIIGAPTFSTILPLLPAMYRIGVSATPKRRDGLQKVLDYNLGKVRVYIDDEHDESSVYILDHDTVYSWYANTSPKIGRFLTEVSEDGSRNLLIAEAACHLYETGRDVLVLSDRIEQLRSLLDLCYYLGIPLEEMGVYAGYEPTFAYDVDAKPLRRPVGATKHEGEPDETAEDGWAVKPGYHYTPVILKPISKRIKKTDLKTTKEDARIIFGTYGMFAKGVDEPRLSGGVDASPRSQAEQVHGRILRKLDGKRRPIWITIADTQSYRSMYSLSSRIDGYVKNNATLLEGDLQEGWTECDPRTLKSEALDEVKRLKSMRIEPNSVGLNTLLTPEQQIRSVLNRARATTRIPTARAPRRG